MAADFLPRGHTPGGLEPPCVTDRGPGFGRWENLRPVGDEDGRGASNGHSGPCPLDHTGPLVFSGDRIQSCPQPHVSPGHWATSPLADSYKEPRGGRAAERGRAALCWPASHLSPASAGLLQFSSRRLITVMEACPFRPLHSTVLWLERSFPFALLSLSLWILLSACVSTQNFVTPICTPVDSRGGGC